MIIGGGVHQHVRAGTKCPRKLVCIAPVQGSDLCPALNEISRGWVTATMRDRDAPAGAEKFARCRAADLSGST
jgi:hypothetical protein